MSHQSHKREHDVPREATEHYHHPAAWPDEKLLHDCEIDYGRTSGPGGQHRNRVATEVTLTHRSTGLRASAGERRSPEENKHMALRRLRLKLAVEHRTGMEAGEEGSALWKSRLAPPAKQVKKKEPRDPVFKELGVQLRDEAQGEGGMRIACNPKHHDYPSLLAEALDAIEAAGWEPKGAAVRLGVSMSQLIKLVKDYSAAWVRLNAEREKRGMHKLK
ncbi:MAG: peptide chain release factor-like protein [Phycisphaerales bacterium]|nr:peptide chain release factor-like protein [Phycisphaerales bacterium]